MLIFDALFPRVAREETRVVTLPDGWRSIPPGQYSLKEWYCIERDCDCRRLQVTVMDVDRAESVATISHAFEPPGPDVDATDQTLLEPLCDQSACAGDLLELFESVVLDDEYAGRLECHYDMVKEAVEDPNHPMRAEIERAQVREEKAMRKLLGALHDVPPRRRLRHRARKRRRPW